MPAQLAQILTAGGMNRQVLTAGVGSAVLLAAVIQTPAVSGFFGCTPLSPVAWSFALGGITTATLLSTALSPLARHLAAGEPPAAGPSSG